MVICKFIEDIWQHQSKCDFRYTKPHRTHLSVIITQAQFLLRCTAARLDILCQPTAHNSNWNGDCAKMISHSAVITFSFMMHDTTKAFNISLSFRNNHANFVSPRAVCCGNCGLTLWTSAVVLLYTQRKMKRHVNIYPCIWSEVVT